MITAQDVDYHLPADADYRWAETNYFCLYVPGEKILAQAFTTTRKALGAQAADVLMLGSLTQSRAEYLYIDVQQHLPAPEKLSNYTTPSGLHVEVTKAPRDYRIDYVGFDNHEIHVDFKALMDPYDINDPEQNPMVGKGTTGMGASYNGHFDMTGHVTGHIVVAGKEVKVDCVETMDHSWGVRPETGLHALGWMNAHFGPDLFFHWINTWDLDQPIDAQHALANGYVVENGKLHGLVDLQMRCTRLGVLNTAMEVVVTDVRGRKFHLHGVAEIGGPWVAYPCSVTSLAEFRWVLPDGRIGHGMCQDNQPLRELTPRRGRRWTATQPLID
jgi:hypothetical protein